MALTYNHDTVNNILTWTWDSYGASALSYEVYEMLGTTPNLSVDYPLTDAPLTNVTLQWVEPSNTGQKLFRRYVKVNLDGGGTDTIGPEEYDIMGLVGYRIYNSSNPGTPLAEINELDAKEFLYQNLVPGQSYTCYVVGVHCEDLTGQVSQTTSTTAIPTPTAGTHSNTGYTVIDWNWTWSGVEANISGFQILASDNSTQISTTIPSARAYNDNRGKPGANSRYIRAYVTNGSGTYYSAALNVTHSTGTLQSPTNGAGTPIKYDRVQWTWDYGDTTNISGYKVYKDDGTFLYTIPKTPDTMVPATPAVRTFCESPQCVGFATGLAPNTTPARWIKAYVDILDELTGNSDVAESVSLTASAFIHAIPMPADFIGTINQSGAVTFSWTDTDDLNDGFVFNYRIDNGDWVTERHSEGTASILIDDSEGFSWGQKVDAYMEYYGGALTDPINPPFTGPAVGPITKTSFLPVDNIHATATGGTKIMWHWSQVQGATQYKLYNGDDVDLNTTILNAQLAQDGHVYWEQTGLAPGSSHRLKVVPESATAVSQSPTYGPYAQTWAMPPGFSTTTETKTRRTISWTFNS